MKKIFGHCFVTLLMVLASCSPKPEEQVKEFAIKFGDFVNTNQKDSVQKYYPEFELKDSLTGVSLLDIKITPESTQGQYKVEYSPESTMIVSIAQNGEINVDSSKGLFAYPANKIDIAKKTGMWDSSLSDVNLAERLNDKSFEYFLKKIKTINTSAIISIGKLKEPQELYGIMATTQSLTNLTDCNIDAKDYSVVVEYNWVGPAIEGYPDGVYDRGKTVEAGKNIPPNSTVTYPMEIGFRGYTKIIGIKWMLSPEQLQEKFAPYTGREYQQYLDSKK